MINKPKRRALYKFFCKGCQKKRSSLVYDRAVKEICTLCRRNEIPDNQRSLFEEKEILDVIEKEINKQGC